MIGLKSLGGVDEGKEGVAAVAEVTTATEVTLHMDGADSEAAVLRDRILEAGSTLSHSTAGFGEDGEDGGEVAGWVEAEDLEEWIWEVSRETSMVEGPYITQWTKSTLRPNSGTSHPKVGGIPKAVGVGDHPPGLTGKIPPGDVGDAGDLLQSSLPLRRCPTSGMKNDRCCSPSNLLGLWRPPHFFKRRRNF